MKFINVRARQCPANGCQAMTLTELMVSVGVGSLVLLAMVMIFMTSSRSFAAMGNYLTMDQAGRNAALPPTNSSSTISAPRCWSIITTAPPIS